MKRNHIGRSKQIKAHQRAMPHSPHMNVKIAIFEDIVLIMEKTRNQYERRGSGRSGCVYRRFVLLDVDPDTPTPVDASGDGYPCK
jgi:hypothetical protein